MDKEYKEKIEQMRGASTVQNWELYQQGLQSLICAIKHDILLSILIKYSKRFVVEFLQTTSESKNEFDQFAELEIKVISEKDVDSLYNKMESHKGKPGVNEFRYSISKISKLFSLDYCSATYIETFLTAISNLFMAIPSQSWGTENPELWYRWLRGTKTEDLLILVRYLSTDLKTTEITKTLWNQLVDDIENIFEQPDHR